MKKNKNFVQKYVVMKQVCKCLKNNPCLCDTEISKKINVPVKSVTSSRITLWYQGIIDFNGYTIVDKKFVKTWKLNDVGT